MLALITGAVDDRSARGIAAAVSRLVTAGTLPAGARLPTVRDVARELGISPTTVSEAWRSLARAGAIQTRGRSGTFVAAPAVPRQRLRYAQLGSRVSEVRGGLIRDFSTGIPDYDLLPGLSEALRRIGDARLTTSYLDGAVLPGLEEVLRERWPFPPEAITVVDGAMDALDRITGVVVRFGDHVLVEDPAFPPTLDLLETVGATVVGVPLDDQGLRPDALTAALSTCDPVALFLQPRAHNPTGTSMTAARADKLARILARHPGITVIEDDHAGAIATAVPVSLGRRLPDRTVHVVSFSKSHGPDLRLAAIGGPSRVVTAVTDRRLLGPGWSSRLLQAVLLDLLQNPATVRQVADARAEYARRRTTLLTALAARGVTATGADGINIWMAVANQQVALLTLAAHGIAVAPGAPFEVTHLDTDHVRITAGLIHDDYDALADIFAEAAGAELRGSGPRSATHPRGWR
ncbi:PLP-dependent aminotransferase family protein [Dactylosporangium matsuzakiense]|uniref:GntR family transcriptional regulator n=1 Tax=Dactylosporangium matsuzakiense TaxID=53360 RepID=A0A9W6KE65_9ACTN|nr:aminotransferase class I/II-fold pyridoxal phosphate-dependent enzyme [Dactylosporangium matsuzakiense]UWZ47166.1 aminotransferase class I/II-fold pyridoxal phosphate-dependent enzyme [Dactylosporangium matsuzakiense]GLK98399.1 GntR family transcriptional regulator [Dactylosporangium matsuzakiense]